MKSLFLAVALLIAAPSFAQIESASLKADGLTCSMCSKAIYKSLMRVPFIQKVDVDIEHSVYNISFKPGAPVSPDRLAKAVTDAGFSVGKLAITARFNGIPVEKDTHLPFDGAIYHFLNVPKQTLTGEKTFTLVDKAFMPAPERRKYRAYTAMDCFETGVMQACCAKSAGVASGTRVYHVAL